MPCSPRFLQSTKDILAEVELNGPREVTEMITEMAAARDIAPASLADFRRNRAVYSTSLNTLPLTFADYLKNIVPSNNAKRAYLKEFFALDSQLNVHNALKTASVG